jgi:hypothetical protein
MRNILLIGLFLLAACSDQQGAQHETTAPTATAPIENAPAQQSTLKLTPMDMAGDMGRVTFSQKELTVFYFDHKTKQGEIVLNNKKFVLDKYNFDSKKEIYEIGNADVSIVTEPCSFKENEGSDCFYGSIKKIRITSKEGELTLQDVDVQDCPLN